MLVAFGGTRVLCCASVSEGVPGFVDPALASWLTAEYAMLPASTHTRKSRERDRVDSRSLEIQRLVGRALRQAVDLSAFAGMTITIDCDVIEADGGTRTAAVTGGWVALIDALRYLQLEERLFRNPLARQIAAVSVGIVGGRPMVDLDYRADSRAEMDLNLVMAHDGTIVEVQGTGERRGATREELNTLMDLGTAAISELMLAQLGSLGAASLDALHREFA